MFANKTIEIEQNNSPLPLLPSGSINSFLNLTHLKIQVA